MELDAANKCNDLSTCLAAHNVGIGQPFFFYLSPSSPPPPPSIKAVNLLNCLEDKFFFNVKFKFWIYRPAFISDSFKREVENTAFREAVTIATPLLADRSHHAECSLFYLYN